MLQACCGFIADLSDSNSNYYVVILNNIKHFFVNDVICECFSFMVFAREVALNTNAADRKLSNASKGVFLSLGMLADTKLLNASMGLFLSLGMLAVVCAGLVLRTDLIPDERVEEEAESCRRRRSEFTSQLSVEPTTPTRIETPLRSKMPTSR